MFFDKKNCFEIKFCLGIEIFLGLFFLFTLTDLSRYIQIDIKVNKSIEML